MFGIIPGKELMFQITYISTIIFIAVAASGELLRTYNVSETEPTGFVVLTESGSGACTNASITPIQLEQYLTFTSNNLTLLRPLDLEVITSDNLTVRYECNGNKKEILIYVMAVNEFAPIFKGGPFTASIKENSPVGTEVIHLREKWQDDDKFKFNTVISFKLYPYLITAFDGMKLFSLDSDTGNLTNSVELDYESLRKSYIVNVSIQDDGGLLGFTTVNISVTDDDDNPPVFDADEYTASVDRFFQGYLEVLPRPVHAMDGDTGIRSNISYTLESDSKNVTNLVIDPKSGRIEVIEPYANVTNGTDFVMFTIKMNITATEILYNHYNTTVRFIMYVYHDFPTTTIPLTTQTIVSTSISPHLHLTTSSGILTTSTSSSYSQIDPILLVEIIVPIVAAVLIIIVIIIIVKNKKKRTRETRYMLSQSEKKRKLDEHDHSKIDVLSSTPINPYEMISVYAKMNHNSTNGDIDQTRRTEQAEYENSGYTANENENLGNTANGQTEENGNPDDVIPPDVYAMVDKRKQRKRQHQPLEILNNTTNHNNDDAYSSLEGSTNEDHGEDNDDTENDQDVTEAVVDNGTELCLY